MYLLLRDGCSSGLKKLFRCKDIGVAKKLLKEFANSKYYQHDEYHLIRIVKSRDPYREDKHWLIKINWEEILINKKKKETNK